MPGAMLAGRACQGQGTPDGAGVILIKKRWAEAFAPAHLFFLIAVPVESSDLHLRALSEISRNLMHSDVREKLMKAESFEEFISVFGS